MHHLFDPTHPPHTRTQIPLRALRQDKIHAITQAQYFNLYHYELQLYLLPSILTIFLLNKIQLSIYFQIFFITFYDIVNMAKVLG